MSADVVVRPVEPQEYGAVGDVTVGGVWEDRRLLAE